MSDYTLSLLLPTMGLAIVAAVARSAHRSWLAPGPFFALFWLMMTLLSVVFAPSYRLWPGGLWLLLAFVISVLLGADVGQTSRHSYPKRAQQDTAARVEPVPALSPEANRRLAWLTGAAVTAGSISILSVMGAAAFPVSSLLSYDALAKGASDLAWRRYTLGYAEPTVARLCLCGIYLGALLGAALWKLSRQKAHRLLAVVPLAVALLYSSVVAARAAFSFALVFFVSVLLCAAVYRSYHSVRLFTAKRCAFITLGVLLLLGVFIGVQHLRDSRYTTASDDHPITHLRLYLCGSLPSFSLWARESSARAGQPSWGVYSAAGLFQLLGVADRALGLYRDFMEVGNGDRTNIYTMFRGLIADFTVEGSVLLLTVCGFISGLAYQRVRDGDIGYLPILTCFYATTICGIATSLFNYNTLVMALILFQILCASVSKGWVSREPHSRWRTHRPEYEVRPRFRNPGCKAPVPATKP